MQPTDAPRVSALARNPLRDRCMQETLYQQSFPCRMMAPLKPTFRLFITCEDQAAFFQARKVQDQVEALCGNEIEISCALWNFALLRHEQLREYAVMEAAEAEMIVISLRASSELPPHVKCWMESLPIRAQVGQAALVTLLGPKQRTWAARHPRIAHLRQIAESRGLNFFCNQDVRERLDFSNRPFEAWKAGHHFL
jgi:hypothetical protein